MKKIWKLKHFDFEDFQRTEFIDSSIIPERDNTATYNAKLHIEEFAARVLDPLWEAWNRYCAFKGLVDNGIDVRTAFIRKSICAKLPEWYKWNYLGYTAEVYPRNGMFEEFVRFLQFWANSSKAVYDTITVHKGYCTIVLKNNRGEKRKKFIFE